MLNSIELHNFKSAKNLSVKLNGLTVLTGLNGSGKSTLLQAITLLKQSLNNDSLNYSLSLQGPIINLGRSEDIRFENSDTDNVTFVVATPNGRIQLNIPTVEGSDTLPLSYDGDIKDLVDQFANGFQLIQADRITPANHYNQANSFQRTSGWLGCRGEFTIDYLIQRGEDKVSPNRLFSDDGYISHEFISQIAPTESLLDQTTGWLQQISPGARPHPISLDLADATALRFSYSGSSIDSNSRDHKAINVGFGLTYCLPIIVACLSAPAGSLLLLENPEAHLHPRGQAALGLLLSRCASDGVQIIVETHSDHVINGIRVAAKKKEIKSDDVSVHFFSRNVETGETSSISPILYDNGRFSEWPNGFFDEWSRALDELLD
ncbi:chromosome segregation protein [Serratia marcescens]|uniref:DUF3696 domain-containing protein n=1 Tax=Serratia TaxID=613 RepID=UPI0007453CFD|nr:MULTISPECIES: DUF3696 domain-containing protein [Serratia]CUZ29810.1 chromosome segregation protein [Serratia marcescens]CUZ88379.1 chromosome segregation protein [Serratia marcescens]CVA02267.1 chromosome segregation protein [Serratia marcescens]CVA11938.1 chromosome segregation protein [Serratia marcescens]CVA33683.1 chromosome segregation protein [Serratia marcescens]